MQNNRSVVNAVVLLVECCEIAKIRGILILKQVFLYTGQFLMLLLGSAVCIV